MSVSWKSAASRSVLGVSGLSSGALAFPELRIQPEALDGPSSLLEFLLCIAPPFPKALCKFQRSLVGSLLPVSVLPLGEFPCSVSFSLVLQISVVLNISIHEHGI